MNDIFEGKSNIDAINDIGMRSKVAISVIYLQKNPAFAGNADFRSDKCTMSYSPFSIDQSWLSDDLKNTQMAKFTKQIIVQIVYMKRANYSMASA